MDPIRKRYNNLEYDFDLETQITLRFGTHNLIRILTLISDQITADKAQVGWCTQTEFSLVNFTDILSNVDQRLDREETRSILQRELKVWFVINVYPDDSDKCTRFCWALDDYNNPITPLSAYQVAATISTCPHNDNLGHYMDKLISCTFTPATDEILYENLFDFLCPFEWLINNWILPRTTKQWINFKLDGHCRRLCDRMKICTMTPSKNPPKGQL